MRSESRHTCIEKIRRHTVQRGRDCIKNNLYHIVYDDGDGKCFSKYAHVTHINTHLTFIQCLKTIEEDLSENEVTSEERECAKADTKKFGSKTSASATRRKQRAQYENAGSYVSV